MPLLVPVLSTLLLIAQVTLVLELMLYTPAYLANPLLPSPRQLQTFSAWRTRLCHPNVTALTSDSYRVPHRQMLTLILS